MADIRAPVAMPNHQNVVLILEVWVRIFFLYNLGQWSHWVTNRRNQVYLPMAEPRTLYGCDPKPACSRVSYRFSSIYPRTVTGFSLNRCWRPLK